MCSLESKESPFASRRPALRDVAGFEVFTALVIDAFPLEMSLNSCLLSWHKKSHMGVTHSIQGFIRHILESHRILFCPPHKNKEITLPLVIRIANCTRQQPFRILASNIKACLRLSCDIQCTTDFSLCSSNMSSDDTQIVLHEREPQSWEKACEMVDARSFASMDEGIDAFMASSERIFMISRLSIQRSWEIQGSLTSRRTLL